MYRLVIFIAVLLASLRGYTQLSMSYSMGGISLENNLSSSFSGPLLLSNGSECLRITNGVAVYGASSAGSLLFDPNCRTSTNNENPQFVLFPNPSPGYTKIYASNALRSGEKVVVTIYDNKGLLLKKTQVQSEELKSGYSLVTQHWAAGFYLVTILYQNRPVNIKLINVLN
jgi:hypothetical protein